MRRVSFATDRLITLFDDYSVDLSRSKSSLRQKGWLLMRRMMEQSLPRKNRKRSDKRMRVGPGILILTLKALVTR